MALELKSEGDLSVVSDADLVADGDKETTYTLQHLTTEKHREFVRKHTSKVPNKRSHQMEERTDWEKVSDDLLDYVITAWSGIVAKGSALECVRVNKLLLDGPRKTAILDRAGMNEIAAAPERRAESFRKIEAVG